MTQPTSLAPANSAAVLEKVVIEGDLSKLSPAERMTYYKAVCESLGLNPLTRPFEYVTLQGKLTLYARKDATEQIRAARGISLHITAREIIQDVYVVTTRATDRTGRTDEATGVVTIAGLKGDALANAMMKAETKSKRRATLSIAGLGIIDETELETVKGAQTFTESDLSSAGTEPQPPGHSTRPAPGQPKRIEPQPGDLVVDAGVPFDTVPSNDELMELAKRKGVFLRKMILDELGKDGFLALTDSDRIYLFGQLSDLSDKPPSRR